MPQKDDSSATSFKKTIRDIVLWVPGFAVGMYAGINLLIPLGFTGATLWVGKKAPRLNTIFLPCISVQIGQILWFALGLVIIGKIDSNLIDILVVLTGVLWLWLKPGLLPIMFLTCFQLMALGINLMSLINTEFGSNTHKALLVHIILRAVALFLMWKAYRQFKAASSIGHS